MLQNYRRLQTFPNFWDEMHENVTDGKEKGVFLQMRTIRFG
jgi:hypothetical protein